MAQRASGRFWIPNWVADGMLPHLGPELKTFLVLARHAGKSGLAWPSVVTISETTGINERTVRRHLRLLEKSGLIQKITSGKGGRGVPTKYRLMAHVMMKLQGSYEDTLAGSPPPTEFKGGHPCPGLTGQESVDNSAKGDRIVHKPGHSASQRGTELSGEGSMKEVLKVYGLDRIGKNNGNGAGSGGLSASELHRRREKARVQAADYTKRELSLATA